MTFNYTDISLSEYPGEISLVLYSPGCNFYCPYCFNRDLYDKQPISFKQAKDAIKEHNDFITAIVLTGGEPLINPNLKKIISYGKSRGKKIKLNTNGFRPKSLPSFLSSIDYLHISLKDPNYCICKTPSTHMWGIYSKMIEYSFVYSPTLMPKPLLDKWVSRVKRKIRPDIFTISQFQGGDCLNPQYDDCTVPTRNDLIEIASLFKDIPKKKLIIETKEFGREII